MQRQGQGRVRLFYEKRLELRWSLHCRQKLKRRIGLLGVMSVDKHVDLRFMNQFFVQCIVVQSV